jgi:CLIP-associating protein 1/2
LTLVQLRRSYPLFPLRPFLSPLVEALEDGDGTVRECARQSVVEIFTGQGVTDAARTDLKKEMTKKGVRKTIVDNVLTKLLSGEGRNTPSGDNVDGKDDPSLSALTAHKPSAPFVPATGRSVSQNIAADVDVPASRAGEVQPGDVEVTPVYVSPCILCQTRTQPSQVASSRDLENEFLSMLPYFEVGLSCCCAKQFLFTALVAREGKPNTTGWRENDLSSE